MAAGNPYGCGTADESSRVPKCPPVRRTLSSSGPLFLTLSFLLPHGGRPLAQFVHPLADQRIQLLAQSPDFVNVVALNQATNQCRNLIGQNE